MPSFVQSVVRLVTPRAASRSLRAAALGAFGAALVAASGACNDSPAQPRNPVKTYVLVHGAWQAQWNWDKVKANLEARGDSVFTLDLPAHGADQTPVSQVTLDGYRDAVVRLIGGRTNVILVGHSAGGATISAVAEQIPHQVSKLVYLAAFLPRNGDAILALAQDPSNAASTLPKYFVLDSANGLARLKPEGLVDLFCADCDAATQQLVASRQQPEPLAPFVAPQTLTAANFGAVPKVYIETLQDHTVSHGLQLQMLARTPVQQRFQLNTSHAAMLSMPDALADILAGL